MAPGPQTSGSGSSTTSSTNASQSYASSGGHHPPSNGTHAGGGAHANGSGSNGSAAPSSQSHPSHPHPSFSPSHASSSSNSHYTIPDDLVASPTSNDASEPASKKRKSSGGSDPASLTGQSLSTKAKGKKKKVEEEEMTIEQTEEEKAEEEKRTKTSRACDRCRGKKTRCDIIPDAEPPLCQHCKNAKLDCTFFLPITETRFKKKRLQEEARAAAEAGGVPVDGFAPKVEPRERTSISKPVSSTSQHQHQQQQQYHQSHHLHPPQPHPVQHHQSQPHYQTPYPPNHHADGRQNPSMGTIPQRQMSGSSAVAGGSMSPHGSGSSERMQERLNARVQGPTSISFLLHSTATIPPHTFDNYDLRHHTAFDISSTGDGLIKVYHPARSSDPNSPSFALPSGVENRLPQDVIEQLVNSYFQNIAPLFPVVSRVEFLKEGKENPLLVYAVCGVAATRRDVPREVFNSLRTTINGIIKHNDVLSDTSLVNIQSLLILACVGDLHSQPLTAATSAAANRLGVAIRMAQDLGLHRDEIARTDDMSTYEQLEERAFLELKRRIWSACVIMDRWYAAAMGMPAIIDLLDCDVLLPDPEEVPLPDRMAEPGADGSPYLYFCEMLKLSILLGRITKSVYGPTGLKHASDHQLNSLLIDMRSWRAALPLPLQFSGPTTSTYQAGILHVYYNALLFLFFRVFMRISYSLPPHLQFSLDIVTWTELVDDSRAAIEWLDRNDHALDTMFLVSYATTSVALVQYHTWARRKDPRALESMKQLRDIGRRWENTVQPDHMSIRRRTMEVMSLLYDAARHTHLSPSPPLSPTSSNSLVTRLNPTPGVVNNRPTSLSHLVQWSTDPSRPGGGVFVADENVGRGLEGEGLAPGVVLGVRAPPPPRPIEQREVSGWENVNPVIGMGLGGGGMGMGEYMYPPLPNHPQQQQLPIQQGRPQQLQQQGQQYQQQPQQQSQQQTQQQNQQQQPQAFDPFDASQTNGPGMVGPEPGYLDGLPVTMYDFNSWDSFFSRFPIQAEVASPQSMTAPTTTAGGAASYGP